ncbi:MAG: transcriptional regulator [Pseudanabaena frigida]|uniref:Transcriptional regulator n=1 Tax=Pseudanabaena frigida TaxID=945775 RepID=A0A2W4VW24_9CYAN|nr:MAG: transcriptional regulator [Pseudanabaena frigida]
MKILLVEDDLHSAEILLHLLAESRYTIDSALSAQSAWHYITTYAYDLIILDIMLPDSNGINLCTKLRQLGYTIPVLLLTAKDSASDRVMGLEAGADDYVVKPYNFQELVARIRALLRRYSDRDTLIQELEWEKLRLDIRTNTVTYEQQPLRLTQKEHGLLEVFFRHPQQIFSRSALIDRVWSAGEFPSEEAVTTHIKTLRQKLKAAGLPIDPIETLYGLGYQLKPKPVQVEDMPIVQSVDITVQPVASIPLPEDDLAQSNIARVQEIIATMAKKLVASLPAKVAILRQVLSALEEGKLDADLRNEGYMEAHRLIGSMGSLGFPIGSTIARQIEEMLKSDFSLLPSNAELLLKLINDLEASTNPICPVPEAPKFQFQHSHLPLLLIMDGDANCNQEIETASETFGIRVQMVEDLATAKEMIANESPDVILLDMLFPDSTDNRVTVLDELAQWEPKIPTLIMTATGGLDDRVMAARKGICSFIEKPTSAEEILDTVSQILYRWRNNRYKVMIVDDDPMILEVLRSMLESPEIEAIALQNPHDFWQVLEVTSPDLLILDLVMPDYSGLDLCQAVRTASMWHDLPIVFLSAHGDRETIRQLFIAGADDYLSKPIVEIDLYTRILSRLERSRLLRQKADFDGLTGVYTHRRGIEVLTQLLRLATRNHQTLCLAILDLDLFKLVNDRYGHGMGDMVLKQFGHLLLQNFRSEDVTMRWGGEEFVVGLYGADLQQSVKRLNIFLEAWRKEIFITMQGESFGSTFSAGVVEYPQSGATIEILYRSMDAALYEAKASGRNRIVAVGDRSQLQH